MHVLAIAKKSPKLSTHLQKKLFISIAILVAIAVIGFLIFNKPYKIVDLSTLSITTSANLSKGKIKIKRGIYPGDRNSDQDLFTNKYSDWIVYDGFQNGLLRTSYGENDFLITYDDKYYFKFRHFLLNRRHQHVYNFHLFQIRDSLYINADIKGEDKIQFVEPMHLISDAKNLLYNIPIKSQ